MSISTPFPGMPQGKPAGVACLHLTSRYACGLYEHPQRPRCCGGLQPSREMCGDTREEALAYLDALELATAPHTITGARAARAVTRRAG